MHRKPEPPEHLSDLTAADDWPALEALLLDIDFLESRVAEGRVHELAADLREAWQAMPADRPARRMIRLIHEALLAEIHFIHEVREHCPHALFQCLWNRGWWYDHPDAAPFFDEPAGGWPDGAPPWDAPGEKLHALLERWRAHKEHQTPGFVWVRSLGPPAYPLGSPLAGTLCGHTEAVRSLAFSPDRVHLASLGHDGTARVWDLRTLREVAMLSCGRQDKVAPGISFSGDGRSIRICPKRQSLLDTPIGFDAVDTADPPAVDWQARTLLPSLPIDHAHVVAVAHSPDDTRVAFIVDSDEITVSVWDAASGTKLWDWTTDGDFAQSLCFSPDGTSLVVCHSCRKLLLFDASTGRLRRELEGRSVGFSTVSGPFAFSPDGRWFAHGEAFVRPPGEVPSPSGMRTKAVCVWDVETGKLRHILFDGPQPPWASDRNLAFSPDGAVLAVGHDDRHIQLWDVETGSLSAQFGGASDAVAFSPDGCLLAAASGNAVRLWNMKPFRSTPVPRGNSQPIQNMDLSVDATLAATTSDSYQVALWDTATGIQTLTFHTSDCASRIRVSPDGNHIAVGLDSGEIEVFDAHTGQRTAAWVALDDQMFSDLAYSPDSKLLASSGMEDHTVGIWDARTGDLVARL